MHFIDLIISFKDISIDYHHIVCLINVLIQYDLNS